MAYIHPALGRHTALKVAGWPCHQDMLKTSAALCQPTIALPSQTTPQAQCKALSPIALRWHGVDDGWPVAHAWNRLL